MTTVSITFNADATSETASRQKRARKTCDCPGCSECAKMVQRAEQESRRVTKAHQETLAELAWTKRQLAEKEQSDERPSAVPALERDRPLPGHQFGVQLIALCIELAKQIGFRGTERTLKKLFEMLGLDMKVPSHDAIEQWTLRLGVGELKDTFTKDDRVIWMADHSSEIGKEKVLLIVGLRVEDLPADGETLNMERLKVLSIVPGTHWKKEDVAREYKKLAKKIGAPAYLICDGATELHEPAESLEKDGKKTIVLGDLKHFAANLLEKQIGRDERFKKFISAVGLTRNRVQQTELGHFAPPSQKQKSRFMNMGTLLGWGKMVLHHLDDPDSPAREGITTERMDEKLGWLREFKKDLSLWGDCQEVIDRTLNWINRRGLCQESSGQLEELLAPWLTPQTGSHSAAGEIATSLVQFIKESECKVPPDERTWLSTEILESLFGRFKQLERQHSKGGFTRLLAAIPTFCCRVDARRIRDRFSKVNSKGLTQWIKEKFSSTLTARRRIAYWLARNASKTSESPA